MKELMQRKVIPALMKAFKVKPFVAIKDGLIYIMPLTIIGSVFMLLGNFPYKPVSDFVYSLGWGPYLSQVTGATFDLMGLVSVAAIAYTYVKNEGYEPLPASIISIVSLIVLNSQTVTDQESGVVVSSVIDKAWMGGKGMITAIIIGLAVGAAYSWFLHHDIRIKLPEQVPEGVSNSFSSLIDRKSVV